MRTTLGYQHKLMYHIFKNLEFISIAKGFEPLYLPSWSSEPGQPNDQTAALLSAGGKLIHFYKDPTPMVAEIALRQHKASPHQVQKYFYQYFYPAVDANHPDGLRHQATAGIESFNDVSGESETQIIALCLELVNRLSFGSVYLELGHAGYMEAFMAHLALSQKAKVAFRHLMAQKNRSGIDVFVAEYGLDPSAAPMIAALQNCFGKADAVLQAAAQITASPAMVKALDDLEKLVAALDFAKDQLHIDLGFPNSQGYYTGAVFKIYSALSHLPLFTGGRYDKNVNSQETPLAACGANLLISNISEVIMMNMIQKQNLQSSENISRFKIALVDTNASDALNALKQNLDDLGLGYSALKTAVPQSLSDIQMLLEVNPELRWLIYSEDDRQLQVIDKAYNQSFKTTPEALISLVLASSFEAAIH